MNKQKNIRELKLEYEEKEDEYFDEIYDYIEEEYIDEKLDKLRLKK